MNFLKKIKKTKAYYFFVRFVFVPIYSFFWEYLLNFKNKIICIFFKIKLMNKEYINMNGNSKKLVLENEFFKNYQVR